MNKYNHKIIEEKWQKYWEEHKVFEVKEDKEKKKFYGLIEFPYPSGEGLHTGHLRSNTAMDIICRKRRMQGYNVLYPIGFDSFGLPAENYAVKQKVRPQVTTAKNIKIFTKQLKEAGFSFDWSRAFSTTDPDYYKWTQWIFIQMFKNGLAEKKKETINWCMSCKIGLANEEVVAGVCERCGGEVVKKDKEQWVLKITKYAERLIDDLDTVDYLERIKTQQINWIGWSEGALVKFKIQNPKSKINPKSNPAAAGQNLKDENYLEVFTTRPDTLFGATFMVAAPEHPLVASLLKIQNPKSKIQNVEEVKKYINEAKKKSDLERTDLNKEKTGVELKGIKAVNPVNGEEIPIYVADYVLMNYGTGAIMAVPAHDERDYDFARKYNISIKKVVKLVGDDQNSKSEILNPKQIQNPKSKILNNESFECFEGEGVAINSGEFNGLTTLEFKEKITKWLEKKGLGKKTVKYKLRDWIFSRQRYWGEPIPLVFCENCAGKTKNQKPKIKNNEELNKGEILNPGWYADENLPVVLPDIDDFMPTNEGDSPLAKAEDWVKTKCPKCGAEARRETDVMPNWAGSNWYFIRYCDPKNNQQMIDSEKAKYWLAPIRRSSGKDVGGVDWYNGGMEHTTLHLLYSRFVWKFLYDIGAVPQECGPEPYVKRTAHGMILGAGGEKMSKSKGNVINPDEYVKKYGADTLRVYEMFMGPFDQAITWEDQSVNGAYRFLKRVWGLQEKITQNTENTRLRQGFGGQAENTESTQNTENTKAHKAQLTHLIHQTIKKVGEDIEEMKFNTAISALMILVNEMEKIDKLPITNYQLLVTLLYPFAPHICEELWQGLGNKNSLVFEKWPAYDLELIKEDEITIAVQVNGKVRDEVKVAAGLDEGEIKKLALESKGAVKWLAGKRPEKVIYVKGKLVSVVV